MPYTENHALLRWGGAAWEGQETWSCGTRLKLAGGDSPAALLDTTIATVEEISEIVRAYVTAPGSVHSNGVQVDWVSLNAISSETGDYLFPNQPVEVQLTGIREGAADAGIPQVAYCVTLRSPLFRRGPAARGRWYVPAGLPAQAVTSTGVIPIATAQAMADAAGTFLSNVASLAGPTDPNVWIPWLYGDGIGGPRDSPIEPVQVGNVWDTQRRRRRQLEESYATSATWDPVNG